MMADVTETWFAKIMLMVVILDLPAKLKSLQTNVNSKITKHDQKVTETTVEVIKSVRCCLQKSWFIIYEETRKFRILKNPQFACRLHVMW